jgi:molybdopterin synthase sulfur carrier subunit
MRLQLRFFASLRETLGPGETLEWSPLPEAATAGALRQFLRGRSQAHADALAPARAVRVAVDQAMAHDTTPLHDGAEVAFFPPVTGG